MGKILGTKKAGFTMVELLIVLVIVAILAAIAAPIYSANTQRAIASDAVAAMSLIRQAEREYSLKGAGSFLTVTDGALYPSSGLNVDLKTAQYFSNSAFGVSTASTGFSDLSIGTTLIDYPTAPVDFTIKANGANAGGTQNGLNQPCNSGSATNCAVNASKAGNMCLVMDNSGRIFVNYSANTNSTHDCLQNSSKWEKY